MKIFLSAIEGNSPRGGLELLIKENFKFKYNLMSYYYIRNKNYDFAEIMRDKSELIMIDSGAHSFQKGKKVDWEEYTKEYAEFIKKFDRPNIVGFFEMDVDNIIGYERVLELRNILKQASNKIIPVWHKNRGIEEFKKMCQEYQNKVIAITGFKNEDIQEHQYLIFLKYAKKFNCKVHCLGMTRKKILDRVPFDYVDSSSWLQNVVYGRDMNNNKLPKIKSKEERALQFYHNYKLGKKMQEYYYEKWRKICKD
jgi:hypothetical protein